MLAVYYPGVLLSMYVFKDLLSDDSLKLCIYVISFGQYWAMMYIKITLQSSIIFKWKMTKILLIYIFQWHKIVNNSNNSVDILFNILVFLCFVSEHDLFYKSVELFGVFHLELRPSLVEVLELPEHRQVVV